ncbi:hypothetical protein [Elongatibacter sediminis]|uniref:Uncharacterized protein n=1 Tax=Elongatibacter sediminis TaxID=3119006 RepID=A0AAW9RFU5_9GAMM
MKAQHLLSAIIISFLACQEVLAQEQACDPLPLPTRPFGPQIVNTWAWYDDMYQVTAWRYPCSQEFSYVVMTVVPLDKADPFVCSAQIILTQGDTNLDDSPELTEDPYNSQPSWCQALVRPTSFALIPRTDDSPIAFQERFVVHWDTGRVDEQFEMFAYDPNKYTIFGDSLFRINEGLNDAWYNPSTSGQGFFVNVFPEIRMMFLAWFTFDTERPPANVQAHLADPGHRWLTAFGPYDGSQAVLDVELTKGGVFNAPNPKPSQSAGGTITVEFSNCESGQISFDLPSIGEQGQVPIQRLAPDLVGYCKTLDGVSE